MDEILIAVILVGAALTIKFVVTQVINRRAVRQVVSAIETGGAIGKKNARSREELGLMPRKAVSGIIRRQDYKANAVNMLINTGFIETTEEGRLYVAEETYNNSSLTRYRGYG